MSTAREQRWLKAAKQYWNPNNAEVETQGKKEGRAGAAAHKLSDFLHSEEGIAALKLLNASSKKIVLAVGEGAHEDVPIYFAGTRPFVWKTMLGGNREPASEIEVVTIIMGNPELNRGRTLGNIVGRIRKELNAIAKNAPK